MEFFDVFPDDAGRDAHLAGPIAQALRLLASPEYLARHGSPDKIDNLSEHRLLGFTAPASLNIWPLPQQSGDGLPMQPVIAASSGETLRHLALAGAGIVCLADFLTRNDISSGRLVPILETVVLPWTQPVWAVLYKQGVVAPRVAALLNFLVQRLPREILRHRAGISWSILLAVAGALLRCSSSP